MCQHNRTPFCVLLCTAAQIGHGVCVCVCVCVDDPWEAGNLTEWWLVMIYIKHPHLHISNILPIIVQNKYGHVLKLSNISALASYTQIILEKYVLAVT